MIRLMTDHLSYVLEGNLYFEIENVCDYCVYAGKNCFLCDNISTKISCGCHVRIY